MKGYLHLRGRVWYTTVDLPRREGSRRKQKCVRLGSGTKKEAEKLGREFFRQIDNDELRDDANMTVADLVNEWLRDNEHRLAPKTYEGYESKLRRHVIPSIGAIPLRKLKPRHFIECYAGIREKRLSPQTQKHIHRALHTAFNYGVKTLQVLKSNPIANVTAPVTQPRELTPLTNELWRNVVEAAKGTRLEVPILIAALTGLRRSELLGLRWQDVFLDRESFFVTHVLEQSRRYGVRLRPRTKNRSSRRPMPLAPMTCDILREHRKAEEASRQRGFRDHGLVFCNVDGSPWPPDTFTKQFTATVQNAGINGFRLHDLRHAFATIGLHNGVNVKEVSVLMGHSTPLITMTTYAHTMEGVGREAVNGVAHSLLGDGQVANPA